LYCFYETKNSNKEENDDVCANHCKKNKLFFNISANSFAIKILESNINLSLYYIWWVTIIWIILTCLFCCFKAFLLFCSLLLSKTFCIPSQTVILIYYLTHWYTFTLLVCQIPPKSKKTEKSLAKILSPSQQNFIKTTS